MFGTDKKKPLLSDCPHAKRCFQTEQTHPRITRGFYVLWCSCFVSWILTKFSQITPPPTRV
jgi:hypothetical protein